MTDFWSGITYGVLLTFTFSGLLLVALCILVQHTRLEASDDEHEESRHLARQVDESNKPGVFEEN